MAPCTARMVPYTAYVVAPCTARMVPYTAYVVPCLVPLTLLMVGPYGVWATVYGVQTCGSQYHLRRYGLHKRAAYATSVPHIAPFETIR
eukprot:443812-Rhodomonas_salina.1